MKRLFFASVLFSMIVFACTRVPISNRKQVMLVGDSDMNAMALTSYKSFLDTNKVIPATNAQTQMVKRVGDKIAAAAQQYFVEHKKPDYLADYKWETNLVESSQVNAWCMPGGKMVVYTGILPIAENETGLAVVMGHEVSHAIAKHGGERMSQGILAQGLGSFAAAMVSKKAETINLWNQVFGAVGMGTILAYGRKQELEADRLGLIFMAMAGYNPEEAVTFWTRMAKQSENQQKPPVFLSTHPADEKRIKDIVKYMPDALKQYGKVSTTRY
jgi:predicted Zn-dependent protease